MELLRVTPFPLTLEYSSLPEDLPVIVTFASTRNSFIEDVEATVSSGGTLSVELSERFSRYDGEYSVVVYEVDGGEKGDALLMDTLRIVRPYIDSAALAPLGQESDYAKYERMARIMIDNVVGGFYYTLASVDLQGTGSDRLVVGGRVNKLLRVIENNALLYEINSEDNIAEYTLNSDKTAVILFEDSENNMADGRPALPVIAGSDSYDYPQMRSVAFPNGYDYTVQVENGWPMVPQDIKEAATLIVEDMACGAPNY